MPAAMVTHLHQSCTLSLYVICSKSAFREQLRQTLMDSDKIVQKYVD